MYVRNRVPVRHCAAVEGTVVTTRTPVSRSLLGDHVERGVSVCACQPLAHSGGESRH